MSPRANVLADTGLRAGISLSLQEFKDFVRGVALLAGKLFILCQQCFHTQLIRPKDNGRAGFREMVGSRGGIRNGSFNGHAGVSCFPRYLPERLFFKVVGSAHTFAFILACDGM